MIRVACRATAGRNMDYVRGDGAGTRRSGREAGRAEERLQGRRGVGAGLIRGEARSDRNEHDLNDALGNDVGGASAGVTGDRRTLGIVAAGSVSDAVEEHQPKHGNAEDFRDSGPHRSSL